MELEAFKAENGGVKADKIQEIEGFDDSIIESDILIALLVAAGEKKGGDIEGFFSTRERFDSFVELMNDLGVNCYVRFGIENSKLDWMLEVFDETDNNAVEGTREMVESAEVEAHIFLTKEDSYGREFFEELLRREPGHGSRYHRMYGEFLGIPDLNVDSFVFKEKPGWKRKLLSLLGKGEERALLDAQAIESYGKDLPDGDKRTFVTFSFGLIRDSQEGFENALERARERREALEELGIDTSKYVSLALEEE